ncbi:MAG: hypothetical protein H0U76_19825 [Ktedonobacteraceae bacterium]|nr:hypothetical protein [Ktedonobacteraceae bacterium]
MEYPPPQQPPMHQPHASSEIYLPEQPLSYTPQYQPHQPLMPMQDIAIYPNRRQVIWRTVVCAISLLFMILIAVLFSLFIISLTSGDMLASGFLLPPLLTVAFFLSAEIIYIGWITWRMAADFLFTRKPILFINREGIKVSRMPTLSGFFIPWAEVDSLSTYTFIYTYFCIHPKNTREFLARFNIVERLMRRSNMLFGIPPLIVPQLYLERSSEEILRQVYYMYANELSYYHVRLQPRR